MKLTINETDTIKKQVHFYFYFKEFKFAEIVVLVLIKMINMYNELK